jgi:2'-5' RNA ligase
VRLFVAAEIGEHLATRAEALIVEIKRRVAEVAPRARVTWLTAPRLHITIRFIGDADHARAETIVRELEPPLRLAPFDLGLAGVGVFPGHGPPRAVWAGVERGLDAMVAVEREVASRVASIGIPGETRSYRPHLTLARVREAAGLRSARLLEGLERELLGTTRIDAITLFESRLSPAGPTYVPILRTSLGRPT